MIYFDTRSAANENAHQVMEPDRIHQLLEPYLRPERLSQAQVSQVVAYLDLLLRWNARMNLTAVRDPEQIVTRHFGESFFAARILFPDPSASATLADVGSGAGFPGLPIALLRPMVEASLIEAHGKKAIFLKEVCRVTGLENVAIVAQRAEVYAGSAEVVTFRAVEDFAGILPISANLVVPGGRLAALLGSSQVTEAKRLLGEQWGQEGTVYFPGSTGRVLWISHRTK